MTAFVIRRGTPMDGTGIRRLITETLLQSGFGVPDETRDPDLLDDGYYQDGRRAIWVSENPAGALTGCVAIDEGEPGIAVLRRLAGEPLEELVATAVAFARASAYEEVETVLPPGMEAARDALTAHGFTSVGEQALLYRLLLPGSGG